MGTGLTAPARYSSRASRDLLIFSLVQQYSAQSRAAAFEALVNNFEKFPLLRVHIRGFHITHAEKRVLELPSVF